MSNQLWKTTATRVGAIAIGILAAVGIVGAIQIASVAQMAREVSTGQGPCDPSVLCDEASAIAEALTHFPVGHNPNSDVARLITLEDALQWRGSTVIDPDDPTVIPPSSTKPVWLVGILGDGLTVADFSPNVLSGSPEPVEGMWFIFQASGRGLQSLGGLSDSGGPSPFMTLASIQAIVSQPLSIMTPTPVLTSTPGPAPTDEPP